MGAQRVRSNSPQNSAAITVPIVYPATRTASSATSRNMKCVELESKTGSVEEIRGRELQTGAVDRRSCRWTPEAAKTVSSS